MKKLALYIIVAVCCLSISSCKDDSEIPENPASSTPDKTEQPQDKPSEESKEETPEKSKGESSDESTEVIPSPTEPTEPVDPTEPVEPDVPEDPIPDITYIETEIIPYEEDLFTAFFYASDDEGYGLESNVMVTWNFGDGSQEETWPGNEAPSHLFPTVQNVEYTVSNTFQIGDKHYKGQCVIGFDDDGKLVDFESPDIPDDDDDNPSQYYTKVANNGSNPLITSKFDNMEIQQGQLRIFLKITGESPRDALDNGVFIRKNGAAPRDIQLKGSENIKAEEITLYFGLKSLGKLGESEYSRGQGFGYDDGTKFDIPFYYSAPWMTVSASGGSLDLGNVVIWDLQSTGIFGTGDFEHTTWAWKQTASISISSDKLKNYNTQTHYPYVLVTIHAIFTDAVNYTWQVLDVKLLDR